MSATWEPTEQDRAVVERELGRMRFRRDRLTYLTDDEWAADQPSGVVAGFAVVALIAFICGLLVGALVWA